MIQWQELICNSMVWKGRKDFESSARNSQFSQGQFSPQTLRSSEDGRKKVVLKFIYFVVLKLLRSTKVIKSSLSSSSRISKHHRENCNGGRLIPSGAKNSLPT